MNNPHALLKASFRAKVLASFVICIVAVMAVTMFVVDRSITQQSEKEARNALTSAKNYFLNSERVRTHNLLLRFQNLPNDTRNRAAFQQGDAKTLKNPLQRLMQEQGVDIVFYVNDAQKVLDCEEKPEALISPADFEKAAAPAVSQAMQEQPKVDTVRVGRQLFDVVAIPVHDADGLPLGVLVIGTKLGDGVALEFSRIIGGKIALIAGDQVVASTLSGTEAGEKFTRLFNSYLLNQPRDDEDAAAANVEQIVLDGQHYYGIAGRFKSESGDASIGYVLLNSNESSLRAAADAKELLLGVSLCAILVGATVVWLLVKRVTQPLLELRDSAEAVGRGDFSRRVPVRGRDEFGKLAGAFNQMTQDVQQSRAELEQTVTTLKTTQQQLIQSEKLSAVGEFVAGVAHELNNPLAAVMGFSEMLKDANVDAKHRRHLDIIFKSAQRCQKIVLSLLSFARRHKPERKPVCVNAIVEAVLEIVAYPLRTSNVEVVTQFDGTLPVVLADEHQIQQVVLNLINNARQAIEEHGPLPRGLIKIITEAAAGHVRIIINDNGPGIPPENLGRIFDPFFTTKEVGTGTGLGLSLCYGIIREHGGSIMPLNRPGGGATFIIELPAMDLPGDTTEMTRVQKTSADPDLEEGAGKKILIIDDEQPILDMLRENLVSHGYEVDVAGDGETALGRLKENRYDVTLCDWKMPGLNGRQVYENFRTRQPGQCRSFIFISGDVVNEQMRGFLETENRACLSKPFSLADVRNAIKTTLAEV